MSTKTIAVDTRVYARLAAAKREGESFSKTIDRLLNETETAGTGNDVLRGLASVAPLPPDDAEAFLEVIAENRSAEAWKPSDLR